MTCPQAFNYTPAGTGWCTVWCTVWFYGFYNWRFPLKRQARLGMNDEAK